MQFADIKNDFAFRKIFENGNKTEILISFLNAVLKLEGADRHTWTKDELEEYKHTRMQETAEITKTKNTSGRESEKSRKT